MLYLRYREPKMNSLATLCKGQIFPNVDVSKPTFNSHEQ